jgi:hypothetical protein
MPFILDDKHVEQGFGSRVFKASFVDERGWAVKLRPSEETAETEFNAMTLLHGAGIAVCPQPVGLRRFLTVDGRSAAALVCSWVVGQPIEAITGEVMYRPIWERLIGLQVRINSIKMSAAPAHLPLQPVVGVKAAVCGLWEKVQEILYRCPQAGDICDCSTLTQVYEAAMHKFGQLSAVDIPKEQHRLVVFDPNPSNFLSTVDEGAELSVIDLEYATWGDSAQWLGDTLAHMCYLDWGYCTTAQFPFSVAHREWVVQRYVQLRLGASDPVDAHFVQRAELYYALSVVRFLLLKVVFYAGSVTAAAAPSAAAAVGHAAGQMGRGQLPAGTTSKLRDSLMIYYRMESSLLLSEQPGK